MPRQSILPEDTTPATGDFLTGINSTPTASRFKIANLITLFFNNIPNAIIGAASIIGTKLAGAGTTISGSAPSPTTNNFFTQAGSSITATNGSGIGTVGFPTTFPNGLLTVVIVQGDTTAGNVPFAVLPSSNGNHFDFQCPTVSALMRLNWIAIGF